MGFGETIFEGESARPLAMSADTRRECRFRDEAAGGAPEEDFPAGTSKMFSLRPVVGSVVNSRAGSCET